MIEKQHPRDLREIRALLPQYVSGTLDPARAAKVRARIARSRELAAEVAWLERLREMAKHTSGDVADSVGAQTAASAPPPEIAATEPATVGRALASLPAARIPHRRAWTPVVALAVAAVGLYGLAAGGLGGRVMLPPAAPAAKPPEGARFIVTFEPDARMAQIQQALARADARIVDGPDSDGRYVVRIGGVEKRAALAAAEGVARVDEDEAAASRGQTR